MYLLLTFSPTQWVIKLFDLYQHDRWKMACKYSSIHFISKFKVYLCFINNLLPFYMLRSQVFPFLMNCPNPLPSFSVGCRSISYWFRGAPYMLRNLIFCQQYKSKYFHKVYFSICWWIFFTIVKGYLNLLIFWVIAI